MNQSSNPMVGQSFEDGRKPHGSGEPYHFNADEMRVLKECNRESFYQRSLPLGTLLGLGTFYAVKSGYFRTSARWGATPKVIVAAVTGYFFGKLSYQKTCAEKMMALPNSPLGETLRRRRQQAGGMAASFSETLGLESMSPPSQLPSGGGESSYDSYAEHGSRSMDLDLTRPPMDSTIGDIRPERADVYLEEEPLPAAQQSTTYEELRRANREDYERRHTTPRIYPGIEDPPQRQPLSSPSTPAKDQNKYGDTWVQ